MTTALAESIDRAGPGSSPDLAWIATLLIVAAGVSMLLLLGRR